MRIRKNNQMLEKSSNRVNIDQFTRKHKEGSITRARDVLKELHALLENYAPVWFTQRLHERTSQAMSDLNASISYRASRSVGPEARG